MVRIAVGRPRRCRLREGRRRARGGTDQFPVVTLRGRRRDLVAITWAAGKRFGVAPDPRVGCNARMRRRLGYVCDATVRSTGPAVRGQ